ncbi:MAG TPA: hypothetical protein VI934_03540 [Candidatus Nanoarchaeia archaeon]|nr:hypothetical protein [Candidatus Nanoarchaeia archaeon]
MKKHVWHIDFGEDSLEILGTEIENLENDELSVLEAGFLSGYEADEESYEET